jgi:hypothetical protein
MRKDRVGSFSFGKDFVNVTYDLNIVLFLPKFLEGVAIVKRTHEGADQKEKKAEKRKAPSAFFEQKKEEKGKKREDQAVIEGNLLPQCYVKRE